MRTQFDIPTQPMGFLLERGPRCCGACQQGRADCLHPMICSAQLTDVELADALAEVGHDTRPATLDDIKVAGQGVADGVRSGMAKVANLFRAVWRAL